MSKAIIFAVFAFATVFSNASFAMETRIVEIKKHDAGSFWVIQKSNDLRGDAKMVGASEAVVDKIDALDFAKDYVCDAKYRDMGTFTRGSLIQVMVYDLKNCAGRTR